MKNFRHRHPIQLRFKDADRMGHIHNANYLSFAEEGRLAYFRDVLGADIGWHRQDGLILARTELDFRQPIFPEDVISVRTRCALLGTKSFQLQWAIVRENAGSEAVIAEGITVLACYDYEQRQTIPIPEFCRQKMTEFDGLENGV
jgi:acyl-CoA thioester hydrolase